ncbi:MAG: SpaA isopeptide-forming pilin-related protein [Chloroflexota bacterium]|nr:SpaA isopeptide-forming pilin-related protein [Chloroflexota bacterium]
MNCGIRLSLLLTAVFALAVVGCSEIGINLDTPPTPSGIKGTVLLGPTCPVEASPGGSNAVPCLTPYAATMAVLDNEGVKVATITSGADGKFQVDLPPGDYVVTPESGTDTYPIAQPQSVTVATGVYTDIEVNYDTGIR